MTPSQVLAEWGPAAGLLAGPEALSAKTDRHNLKSRFKVEPFLMAPMAGVSDAAYRTMARAGGAGLAYTEMVSCAGLHYGGEKTWELVEPAETEPDIAVQLFGSKPELFREAATSVLERLGNRLALIDINMACPVPKVTKKGEGSALLDNPELAAAIVQACIEGAGAQVPVTAKIRRGRRMGEEVAPEFARAMEAAGASAIAVHGRFANQLYHGEADWGCVSPRSQGGERAGHCLAMSRLLQAAARMLAETGASAVMVARGSYGNPWIFRDAAALRLGRSPSRMTREKIAAFRCHVRLLAAPGANLKRARSLAGWYLRGMPEAARLRGMAVTCLTLEDYLAVADEAERMLCDAE